MRVSVAVISPGLGASCALFLGLLLLSLLALPARANELETPEDAEAVKKEESASKEEPPDPDPKPVIEERVSVIGSLDEVKDVPGSAHYLGPEELARHQYSDVHRLLRRVPGVYLQEEEGFGLRPNIGMRGTGVERSQKITLMEDGTLIAPAPYAAPAAYYVPTLGRMSALEISKGPSAIEHGPNTNGGVINLISTPIPTSFGGKAVLALGDRAQRKAHVQFGDSGERVGWVLETFQQGTHGFKRLDRGGDTGFDLADYMGKVQVGSRSGSRVHHSLELKLGRTDQQGRETYLGLTQEDFELSPFRRYAASSRDHLDTEHRQLQLRYFIVGAAGLDLTTTAYFNDFSRNWRKLESVRGLSLSSVVADPELFPDEIAMLRGEIDSGADELKVRNNRRSYWAGGVESVLGWRLLSGKTRHGLELGLRLHEDEEDRLQEEDGFQMVEGAMVMTSAGARGSQSNRVSRARAVALFAHDRIERGKWSFSPGLRLERIDFERTDFDAADPQRAAGPVGLRQSDVAALMPGMGAQYQFRPHLRLFGGLHRGFAPPGPSDDDRTDPEQSLNYEAGVRYGESPLSLQAVAFYSDYENLLGRDTTSSGGTGSDDLFNGGAVEVAGLELSINGHIGAGREAGPTVPWQLAYTHTGGEFRSSFSSPFEEWGEVVAGDELPYLPEHQAFAEVGWLGYDSKLFLNTSYVGAMRARAGRGSPLERERIDSHLIFDLSAEHTFGSRYAAFLQFRNLTDEVYVAARRPAGLRPGLPRSVLAGFGIRF